MKKHILLLAVTLGVTACSQPPAKVEPVVLRAPEHFVSDYGNTSSPCYHVVKIDSCEYILMGSYESQTLTHKGNCSNPIHYHRADRHDLSQSDN